MIDDNHDLCLPPLGKNHAELVAYQVGTILPGQTVWWTWEGSNTVFRLRHLDDHKAGHQHSYGKISSDCIHYFAAVERFTFHHPSSSNSCNFPFKKMKHQKLPSWELTYPLKSECWRWFSFSQGGICLLPRGYKQLQTWKKKRTNPASLHNTFPFPKDGHGTRSCGSAKGTWQADGSSHVAGWWQKHDRWTPCPKQLFTCALCNSIIYPQNLARAHSEEAM